VKSREKIATRWFMTMEKNKRRAMSSWLFVSALFVLCGVLGFLQYRWTGEVSVAARERLRGSLQASLNRLSQDFNSEITTACLALLPTNPQPDAPAVEAEIAGRYQQWKKAARHGRMFRRIALAAPKKDSVALRSLDPETGRFTPAEWPPAWKGIKERLEFRLSPPWQRPNPPAPPSQDEVFELELPLLRTPQAGTPPGSFARREAVWLIFDLDLQYAREAILPELVQRHLGADYQVEVVAKTTPPAVIYQSDPGQAERIATSADASVSLFEPQYEQIFRSWGTSGRAPGRGLAAGFGRPRTPGARDRGPGPGPGPDFGPWQTPGARERGPGRGSGPDFGRWQMFARNRAGSLEAVVSRARWRNLAVTAAVLLLMVASVAALIRFTRRAQKLAELQMDFVAGVSHELRTPLTVIHTAAYNLRGKMANNPSQVERYGALIQQESGRLTQLVEQVLRFASANEGRVIQEPEPLSVQAVIDETVESSKAILQESQCVVEKKVDPGLPLILGDPTALKHALQNLLGNAAKYGTEGSNWIGLFASKSGDGEQAMVEIRVADRGPGIPEDEQKRIFDPFFRGRRAVQDQVHGAGLGLNLVKKIVEAHGGSIRVKSEPMKGTEFIVWIPAAPAPAAPAGASP
jgi:signal transduction histidine kinase